MPAIFYINVPDRGKIRDIRVWVEVLLTSGSNNPLGELSISLKSPNVKWDDATAVDELSSGSAIPMMNCLQAKQELRQGSLTAFNSDGSYRHQNVLFQNSFLLWDGSRNVFGVMSSASNSANCPSWMNDRHIRTIFCDSALIDNPRHLDRMRLNDTMVTGSPSYGCELRQGTVTSRGHFDGNDRPWISDWRLQYIETSGSYLLPGSPPDGWLTGPGGVAAENEWPTTGSNYGASMIKPVYPMLDPLYEEPYFTAVYPATADPFPGSTQNYILYQQSTFGVADSYGIPRKLVGFRPGLFGTQIQGTWQICIMTHNVLKKTGLSFTVGRPGFFIQARIEILYDETNEVVSNNYRPRRQFFISGSGGGGYSANIGMRKVTCGDEHDKIYSITDSTSSSDWSVFSRPAGEFADQISGSDGAHARWAYLHNEFGTPFIPVSSGSAGVDEMIVPSSSSKSAVAEIIAPTSKLAGGQRLHDLIKKGGASKTREALAMKLTGSR
jgi:hypothetical protein